MGDGFRGYPGNESRQNEAKEVKREASSGRRRQGQSVTTGVGISEEVGREETKKPGGRGGGKEKRKKELARWPFPGFSFRRGFGGGGWFGGGGDEEE